MEDVIVAIILAYEFEQRLCEFAVPGVRERKWHHATLTQSSRRLSPANCWVSQSIR